MKYIMPIVIIFLAAALIFCGYLVSVRIDFIQYERDVTEFTAYGMQYGATAEYNGIKVQIHPNNLDFMCSKCFTITERKKINDIPSYKPADAIRIWVDDEYHIIVIRIPNSEGDVYIETVIDGKKRNFFVSGDYRIYERVLSYVGVEGYYGPNTLIEEP
jgi:hypothetical protein